MGQELVVPQGFDTPSTAFATLDPTADNLADGIGQSYGVIGYKGKIWSLRYRGERKTFIRPDDGTPAAYLDVVFIGQAANKSKSYFTAYDQNNPDGGDAPLCSSMDGLKPDKDVRQKQADACALCPRNAWRTDPKTGRRGRECQDYKRTAVLVLPTQTKLILGEPLLEPIFLRVPPASLNALAILGETMAKRGFHYATYVTRIMFDPNKAWPEMVFRPLQKLSDAEAPTILEMMKNPVIARILQGTNSGEIEVAEEEPVTILPPSSRSASSPGVITSQTPLTPSFANDVAPPATPVTIGLAPSTKPLPPEPTSASGLSGGANGVIPTGTPPSASVIPANTSNEAGVTEETDADLDARIAAMLTTNG